MDLTLLYVEANDLVIAAVAIVIAFVLTRFERSALLCVVAPSLFVMVMSIVLASAGFDAIRMVFNGHAVLLPAIAILFFWKRREDRVAVFMAGGLLLFGPLAFWSVFVEPRRLDVTTTVVDTGLQLKEPVRVVVLSDIQTDSFGPWEQKIAQETNALKPDVILIPGDLVQATGEHYAAELQKARAFLSSLKAPGGVFIVQGDTDRNVRDYGRGTGVIVLDNETATRRIQQTDVSITGTVLNYGLPGVSRAIDAVDTREEALNIVFFHRPATVLNAKPTSKVDLFVAGHTHGGQISVPFFGPPVTMSPLPRDVAAGGLSKVNGQQLFVSRGLGVERMGAPRIRFNCRPELALLLVQ